MVGLQAILISKLLLTYDTVYFNGNQNAPYLLWYSIDLTFLNFFSHFHVLTYDNIYLHSIQMPPPLIKKYFVLLLLLILTFLGKKNLVKNFKSRGFVCGCNFFFFKYKKQIVLQCASIHVKTSKIDVYTFNIKNSILE